MSRDDSVQVSLCQSTETGLRPSGLATERLKLKPDRADTKRDRIQLSCSTAPPPSLRRLSCSNAGGESESNPRVADLLIARFNAVVPWNPAQGVREREKKMRVSIVMSGCPSAWLQGPRVRRYAQRVVLLVGAVELGLLQRGRKESERKRESTGPKQGFLSKLSTQILDNVLGWRTRSIATGR